MSITQKMNDTKRVEFAKQIEQMYDATQPSWKRLLLVSFAKGVATGFGVFIGGTIVVALVLWILSGLGQVPFVNDISESTKETLEAQTGQ
jgi:hypothetical protein